MPATRIYLDHSSSTPVDERVFKAMVPWFTAEYGNPHSSEHAFGWKSHEAVEIARAQVAKTIGADADELIFTSGATEANNLAILGIARSLKGQRDHILVSAIDHAAVLEPAYALEREGFTVKQIPVLSDGQVDLEQLRSMLSSRVALVSTIAVNNEIGSIQPLGQIAAMCHEVGALFHSDAAQALTAMEIDVGNADVDFMSFSAHKVYGPKGIGALYMRNGAPRPASLFFGGGQERGLRPGTLPVPLCVGFGAACDLIARIGISERTRVRMLTTSFLELLQTQIDGVTVNGSLDNRHPGNMNLRFSNIDARMLVDRLQPDIACSTGSACHSGSDAPSHVLRAIGLSAEEARSCIRFGFGRTSSQDDVAIVSQKLVEVVRRT